MITAVYKSGSTLIDGVMAECKIVPNEELEQALQDGWVLTLAEIETAIEGPAKDAPATRDEMIQQLEKSGVEVDKRWGNARLLKEIGRVNNG